ncbi:MAG: alpha/beta fold hydrolase [Panacagrimonas sp.]
MNASDFGDAQAAHRDSNVPILPLLPNAVSGTRRHSTGRTGRLSYYTAGSGTPLLLVHSINAAPSAYEMRPLFERMRGARRVYAVDLPGFGFSDRDYNVQLYVDAIHDMLDVIEQDARGVAVDVVGLSLSSEFVALAAVQRPQRVRTLTLVTPTGFNRGAEKLRGPAGGTREIPGLLKLYSFPWWSQGLYDLLASRRSIRYFLRRTYGSKRIHEHVADYAYLSSHQPGARHAPLAFLSMRLSRSDIRDVYERLALPVWLPHGRRGDFRDFSSADWTQSRSNWHVKPFDTGALVHYERPGEFSAKLRIFLGDHDSSESLNAQVARADPPAEARPEFQDRLLT